MTQARSSLIAPGSPGTFHCVQRCVRRAFLCGIDHYSGRSFEHRKDWIEQRLARLADCFAVAIHDKTSGHPPYQVCPTRCPANSRQRPRLPAAMLAA
jgi:hypothetical protein